LDANERDAKDAEVAQKETEEYELDFEYNDSFDHEDDMAGAPGAYEALIATEAVFDHEEVTA
jgi:hypothetical protein